MWQSKDQYEEVDERERMPHYEQRKWEEEQMSSAVFHFGAKQRDQQQEYDLVLENQIDFIQALCMPGNRDKDKVTSHVLNPNQDLKILKFKI